MTLEELQMMVASHERRVVLIADSVRTQGEWMRLQEESLKRQSAHIDKVVGAVSELAGAVKSHDEQIVELRGIVGEVAVMLQNFIASLQGGMKNGGPKP